MTDSSPCDHRWLRLPVVTFSVTYQCQDCPLSVQAGWLGLAARTMEDLDRAFEAEYGGKVTPSLSTMPRPQ